MRGSRAAIKVNDQVGPYFPTHKGVGQGDPIAPLLFDIVVDGLAMMIKQAQQQGLISGLAPHLVDGGLALLQYADDTIFLMKDDILEVRNLKYILCIFSKSLGSR